MGFDDEPFEQPKVTAPYFIDVNTPEAQSASRAAKMKAWKVDAREFEEARNWIENRMAPERRDELKALFLDSISEEVRKFYEPKFANGKLPTRFIAWVIFVMEGGTK